MARTADEHKINHGETRGSASEGCTRVKLSPKRDIIVDGWNNYSVDNFREFSGDNGHNAEKRVAFEFDIEPLGDAETKDLLFHTGDYGEIKKVEHNGRTDFRLRLSIEGAEGIFKFHNSLTSWAINLTPRSKIVDSLMRGNFSKKNVFGKDGMYYLLENPQDLIAGWNAIKASDLVKSNYIVLAREKDFYVISKNQYDEAFELESIHQARPTIKIKNSYRKSKME